jgi:hypothetical protein
VDNYEDSLTTYATDFADRLTTTGYEEAIRLRDRIVTEFECVSEVSPYTSYYFNDKIGKGQQPYYSEFEQDCFSLTIIQLV